MDTTKSTLKFHALFFPETMQAEFEKEQKCLRRLFEKESSKLFSFFPPCIPFAGKIKATPEASLSAGALKAKEGWLYRPAAFLPETAGRIPAPDGLWIGEECGKIFAPSSGKLKLLGEGALILGFAGDLAQALLEKALGDQTAKARFSAALKAQSWYCAEVSVLAGIGTEESSLFAFWSEGKPLWKRRGAAFEADSTTAFFRKLNCRN